MTSARLLLGIMRYILFHAKKTYVQSQQAVVSIKCRQFVALYQTNVSALIPKTVQKSCVKLRTKQRRKLHDTNVEIKQLKFIF